MKFSCSFSEWAIFQYELQQQEIEFQEDYTAEGVAILAKLQVHQIEGLAKKIQDVTRGREQLRILEEQQQDAG